MSSSDARPASTGPVIVAPEVRDLDLLARSLSGWLGDRLQTAGGTASGGARDAVRLEDLRYPLGAGMSHETILFDALWDEGGQERRQGMVVRIKPTRQQVYQDDMFEQQYRLMCLMHADGQVPVARPLWIEHDPALLGAPFFVMEKVAGRVAVSYPPYSKEGWLVDTAPSARRLIWEDAVRQLANIQRVPVSGAAFLNLPGTFAEGFDQEVDRWRRFMDWIDPEAALDLLRRCFDALLAARPGNRPEGIVWGDARLGNMMIGDDNRVVAVMDWEQPSLGGALHDLGWWVYSDYLQTTGRGVPTLDGMGSRDETIALWSEVSGKSAADIDWYEAFAAFKMECLGTGMARSRGTSLRAAEHVPGQSLARFGFT